MEMIVDSDNDNYKWWLTIIIIADNDDDGCKW